ncbi:hypothetical protein AVEN_17310-1 [Araneus ventricosus]|uniref:Uncharacterized protein n=1 Tax=Araneus ventricosus TaxID=182803 RepID=A0A4Y2WDF6_ARAVE|nr:hypothetical protein AVEN_17310-1 [Araneus ventricosus]
MELESRNFTSKEPQVADPCPMPMIVHTSYRRGRAVACDGLQDSGLSTRAVAATVTQTHRTASRQVRVFDNLFNDYNYLLAHCDSADGPRYLDSN